MHPPGHPRNPNVVPGWLRAFAGLALAALSTVLTRGEEPSRLFNVPADVAEKALKSFSEQSGHGLIMGSEVVETVRTNAVKGKFTPRVALDRMLAGTGLVARQDEKNGAFVVRRETPDPNARRAPPPTEGSDRPRT